MRREFSRVRAFVYRVAAHYLVAYMCVFVCGCLVCVAGWYEPLLPFISCFYFFPFSSRRCSFTRYGFEVFQMQVYVIASHTLPSRYIDIEMKTSYIYLAIPPS